MRSLTLFCISLIIVFPLALQGIFAQSLLWIENFDGLPNGTKVGVSPNNWSIDYSGRGRFSAYNGSLEAFNMDREGVWNSGMISISEANYVEISMEISWYGGGWLSQPDYMRVYHKVDGGEEVLMFEQILSGFINTGGSATLSKVIKGNDLQIIIRTFNDFGNTSFNRFDNIRVSEVTTFYSCQSGAWNNGNNWSLNNFSGHQTPVGPGIFPTSREGAIIGNGNNINLTQNEEIAFLEVRTTGFLNLNSRVLSLKRGGGMLVESGGRIQNNNPNSSIEISDPYVTNVRIDSENGIDIGKIRLSNNVKINLTGTGNVILNSDLVFLGSNTVLDLDVPVTILGSITTSNQDNEIKNRKSLTLMGNFPTTNQRFYVKNEPNSILNWHGTSAVGANFRLNADGPGSIFNYSASGNQSIIVPQDAYQTLIFSNSGTKTLNGNISVKGDLSIVGSSALNIGSSTINLIGDWNNSSSNANSFIEGTGTLVFSGNTDQRFNSNVSETFYRLQVAKSGGVLMLNNSINVANSMIFSNGIVETTLTNLLTFNNGATHSGSNSNSHVNGPVRKIGIQNFTFPVGSGGFYAPIGINDMLNGDATTHFTAQYFTAPAPYPNKKSTDFSHVSGVEYWDLSRTYDAGNDANCFVELFWTDADHSNITVQSDLIVAHYNSQISMWENTGATFPTANSVRSTVRLTNFSPFTFGSSDGSNALPVDYVSFSGSKELNGNLLQWKTSSERENDYFTIEKSSDGKDWKICGQVKGNGTSNHTNSYQYLDQKPYFGISYYRLKQVDFNGDYEYSHIVSINNSEIAQFKNEKIYPNPTNGEFSFEYQTPEGGTVDIIILNLYGQSVYEDVDYAEAGFNSISLDISNLPKGVYLVMFQQKGNRIMEKIVKN